MFAITMETPGCAPWAGPPRGGVWRAEGPSAQLPPVERTRRRAHAAFTAALLLWVRPIPALPCTPAPRNNSPGARAPAPLPAAGVTAGRFPRGTPPSSPGRYGAGILPPRIRKDARRARRARSAAGRGLAAGVQGRGCEGAIVTRMERSQGLVGRARGRAGAGGSGRC